MIDRLVLEFDAVELGTTDDVLRCHSCFKQSRSLLDPPS
jgi:hypothetical protein